MDNQLKQGVKYGWSENATITLPMSEIGGLCNAISIIVNSDYFKQKVAEAQETLSLVKANDILQGMLLKAYNEDIVQEVIEPDTQS